MVSAALRAITRHGAGVGMDELAATAGTSKTVLYRHFADKEDLYLAVAERVNRLIVRELNAAAARAGSPREAITGIISTYLHLVEKDPEIYRFVVSHPLVERVERDPVQRISGVIADETARTITAQLRVAGATSGATDALAHGLIAMIRTAADRWISSPAPQSADDMARDLTALAWGGLSAVLPTPSTPAGTPEEDR
nr:TetR/AcrR family transcriptional regulator [Kineococcus siccus]